MQRCSCTQPSNMRGARQASGLGSMEKKNENTEVTEVEMNYNSHLEHLNQP